MSGMTMVPSPPQPPPDTSKRHQQTNTTMNADEIAAARERRKKQCRQSAALAKKKKQRHIKQQQHTVKQDGFIQGKYVPERKTLGLELVASPDLLLANNCLDDDDNKREIL